MIVIGDVHGCLRTLVALVRQLPEDEICLVGDLVDRGPMSAGVIEMAIKNGWKCVRGNHEQMMLDALVHKHPRAMEMWLMNGGDATLGSYRWYADQHGEEKATRLMESHLAWLSDLPTVLNFPHIVMPEGRKLVVSHSAHPEDVWYRGEVLDIVGIYSVFGHTPRKNGPELRPHFANLDTGAVYRTRQGYGSLTALQVPQMNLYFQKNVDHDL